MNKENCKGCGVIEIIQSQIIEEKRMNNGASGNPMIHMVNMSDQFCHCENTVTLQDILGSDQQNLLIEG